MLERMMEVCVNEEKCTGCKACVLSCPQHCIMLKKDDLGFEYPYIDEKKCIHCNICKSKCHIQNEVKVLRKRKVLTYAAFHKNSSIRRKSSSGGAFWAAVCCIIKKRGVVYGAVQCSVFDVVHQKAESLEECKKFRKSKYLESDLNDVYRKVFDDLSQGKQVLFSGTGCQVAGLYSYLGRDYENLYTCDIICHGVPSKVLFEKFISDLQEMLGKKIVFINYRNKRKGWDRNQIELSLNDDSKLYCDSDKFLFHRGFLVGLYDRKCCYQCQYAKLPRKGDISLADYWKYRGKLARDNNNTGISLCIISSEKGERLFEEMKKNLFFEETTVRMAVNSCRHLTHAPAKHEEAEKFQKIVKKRSMIKELWKYRKK